MRSAKSVSEVGANTTKRALGMNIDQVQVGEALFEEEVTTKVALKAKSHEVIH